MKLKPNSWWTLVGVVFLVALLAALIVYFWPSGDVVVTVSQPASLHFTTVYRDGKVSGGVYAVIRGSGTIPDSGTVVWSNHRVTEVKPAASRKAIGYDSFSVLLAGPAEPNAVPVQITFGDSRGCRMSTPADFVNIYREEFFLR